MAKKSLNELLTDSNTNDSMSNKNPEILNENDSYKVVKPIDNISLSIEQLPNAKWRLKTYHLSADIVQRVELSLEGTFHDIKDEFTKKAYDYFMNSWRAKK